MQQSSAIRSLRPAAGEINERVIGHAKPQETKRYDESLLPKPMTMRVSWKASGDAPLRSTLPGSENTARKGLFAWVLTKTNGQWSIAVFH